MRPRGPAAHSRSKALKFPVSKLVQDLPPSVEMSDPEVPVAIHAFRLGSQAMAERNPLGREGGSVQVVPPSVVTAMLARSSAGLE